MLKVNGLSIQSAGICLLSPLSFELPAGRLTAIIGTSGSGKSLLAQALMGSVPAGFSLSGQVQLPRGNRIALAAQSASVLDPLRRVMSQLKRRCPPGVVDEPELMARSMLTPKIAACYPHQLSGGMAKRVLLAQASWQQTEFILADEPCCGLEHESASRLYSYLAQLAHKEGRGVLVISHNLQQVLAVADDVLVLRDGDLLEKTTPQKIKSARCAAYTYALWQAMPCNWEKRRA